MCFLVQVGCLAASLALFTRCQYNSFPVVTIKDVSRHCKMFLEPYSVMKSRLPELQNQLQEYEDPYPAKIAILPMLTLNRTHEKDFNSMQVEAS